MARDKKLRYIVTGPGIADGEEPSYADIGPALSRSLTSAERSEAEGTWYVRDSITGAILGNSERILIDGCLVTYTARRK